MFRVGFYKKLLLDELHLSFWGVSAGRSPVYCESLLAKRGFSIKVLIFL